MKLMSKLRIFHQPKKLKLKVFVCFLCDVCLPRLDGLDQGIVDEDVLLLGLHQPVPLASDRLIDSIIITSPIGKSLKVKAFNQLVG